MVLERETRRHHLELVGVGAGIGSIEIRRRSLGSRTKLALTAEVSFCLVMDFDHVRDKLAEVSTLVYHVAAERLIAEADKCDVVCSSCHRMRTQRRLEDRKVSRELPIHSETEPEATDFGLETTQL